jgi:hypothetical protein
MDPVDVPPEKLNTTTRPPAGRLLPAASLLCSVRVTEFPDATVPEEIVISDCESDAVAWGSTVTEAVEATRDPPIFAEMVAAEPDSTPVNVAV